MQSAHINQIIASLKPRAIELLKALVRIPSITGDEENVQQFLAGYLHKMGLEIDSWCPQKSELENHAAFSDDGLPLGKRCVLVAKLPGAKPGSRTIALNGHVDVVPVGDESAWQD